MDDTKRCTRCGDTKDASAFDKRARSKDGLCYQCKSCRADYYIRNRDARLSYAEKYGEDHRAERAAYDASYRIIHRAEQLAYHATYNAEHREDRAASMAYWRRANSDKCRAAWHRRRALKAGNGGTHTSHDVQLQGDSQNWKCWWCGKDCADKHHIDHLIPLAKGGHNNPSNIVIACPHCNTSKGAKTPDEFCGRFL